MLPFTLFTSRDGKYRPELTSFYLSNRCEMLHLMGKESIDDLSMDE